MKVLFGSIVTDGRGKIGGHVMSKNKAGSYLRTKVTPVNGRTAAQTLVRSRFGNLATGWRALTQAQRDAWNNAVSLYAKTDIFGNLKNPSGMQLFQRLNNNLLASGATQISSPVVPKGVLTVVLSSLTYTSGTPALSMVLSAAVPAGTRVKVFATAPVSAGVGFVQSEFRLITTLAAAATTPVNILAFYTAKFGAVGAIGSKIFVAIEFVDSATGLNSTRQITSTISAT